MKRDTKNKNLFQFIKLCYGSIQGRMSVTIVLRRKTLNYQVEYNKILKKALNDNWDCIEIRLTDNCGYVCQSINDSNIPHSDEASITP